MGHGCRRADSREQHAIATALVYAGILIPWAAIFAVAWKVPPPRPLAETRLLARRLIWVARAGWATVVMAGSAIVSTLVALQVGANMDDPNVLTNVFNDLLGAMLVPVLIVAAFLASSTLPFQLRRTKSRDRRRAIESLVQPLEQRAWPTTWLKRFIGEVTTPVPAFTVCYFGALVLAWISYPG